MDQSGQADSRMTGIAAVRREIEHTLREGESRAAALSAEAAAKRYAAGQAGAEIRSSAQDSAIADAEEIIDLHLERLGAVERTLRQRQDRFLDFLDAQFGAEASATEVVDLRDASSDLEDRTIEIPVAVLGASRSGWRTSVWRSAWVRASVWAVLVVCGSVIMLASA